MKNLAQVGNKLALVLFVLFSISVAEMACATGPIRQQASPVVAPQLELLKADAESKAYGGRVPNTEANSITKDPVYKDTPSDAKPPRCSGGLVQSCQPDACATGPAYTSFAGTTYTCYASNGVCTGLTAICSTE